MARREQTGTDVTSGTIYQTFGPVPPAARNEAETMVRDLTDIAPRPVLYAKVKVHDDDQRNPDQRTVAQASMDVSGVVFRAQAAAATAIEALQIVGRRLERRLHRLAERRQKTEKRPPATPKGTWRSGDLPAARPDYFDRPPEERSVVRRKTFSSSDQISVPEALFDLEVLDHRFFLFTDEADGKESIVYETDIGDAAIRKVDGSRPEESTMRPKLVVDETPAPTISVADAMSRLNISDMPFVYFKDSARGCASVLYRRYDGHYGLIVPSTA